MRWIALTAAFWCMSAQGAELLANGSFERLTGDMPGKWNAFVMPMEGATARVDGKRAYDGGLCVMLHNPKAYEQEPFNNWSQNILLDVGGKELLVRGYIRTKDASEAAIWVQCGRRSPFAVLEAFTTSDKTPCFGTADWTPVEMRVVVPRSADFLTIRCMLKGRGTAWFDAISVTEGETSAGDPLLESLVPADGLIEHLADQYDEYGRPSAPSSLDEELAEMLIEAQEAIAESNSALWESSVDLAREINELRAEVEELQEELDAAEAQGAATVGEGAAR